LYQNIKRENQDAIKWSMEKKQKDDSSLKEVEELLASCYNNKGFGFLSEKHKVEIKQVGFLLEKQKVEIKQLENKKR
jgi:hypothetical protein